MTRVLWESLWLLGVVWVGVLFVLIFGWSVQRTDHWRRAVWAGLVMGPLLLVVSQLVVTSRERVENLCRELARAVDAGEVSEIRAALAPEFHAAGLDANEFVDRVERVLSRVRVEDARLSAFDVSFSSPYEAMAEFTASAHIRAEESYLDWLVSRWRLTFRRTGDQWFVTEIETVRTPPLNLPSLSELLR